MSIKRIQELESSIAYHSNRYYRGESDVTDLEFDSMVRELKGLKPESKMLLNGWGYIAEEGEVAHIGVCNSLNKVQVAEMLAGDMGRFDSPYSATPKFDGISAKCYLVDGVIYRAITKGDGVTGKDITEKVKKIIILGQGHKALEGLKELGETAIFRGEIVVPEKNKAAVLSYDRGNGLRYKNTRNFAAGVMSADNVPDELLALLEFVPYTICDSSLTKGQMWMEFNDIDMIPGQLEWCSVVHSKHDLRWFYEQWNKIYPIDGVVLSPLGNMEVESDSFAVKFETEEAEGVIDHVEWNTGKTGAIIPVGVLTNSLSLHGADVTRFHCSNAKFVKDSGIGVGAKVIITRANEVIPHIVRVSEAADSVSLPDACPTCGAGVSWDSVHLVCNNVHCPAKINAQIFNFISMCGIEKGIGSASWNLFINEFNLTGFESLVNYLKSECQDPVEFESKFGTSMGAKIINAIPRMKERLKTLTYGDVLLIMNIANLGSTYSYKLGVYTFGQLVSMDLSEDNTLGTNVAVAKAVRKALPELIAMTDRLGICLTMDQAPDTSGIEVCITGKLTFGTRDEFADFIKHSFRSVGGVSKTTKILIKNDNSESSKTKAARKFGTRILTEAEFITEFLTK